MDSLTVPSLSVEEVEAHSFQVVDVRSPGEFADGHMPGAVNMPLLDDAQRAAVGIVYKQEGAAQARVKAMEEVTPGLAAYLRELTALAATLPRGGRLAVMCWRGGERSRNVVLLLALIGVHAVKVTGGYKAYRRSVLDSLAGWRSPVPVVTLYGHTGAGKSALLRGLAQVRAEGGVPEGVPQPWPLDLEEIALHRGSLLGGLNQPGSRRQKDFDALLWQQVRSPQGDYLVLEGEGAKIGHVFLPQTMAEAIRGGLPVLVKAPLERRTERIMQEYAPDTWSESDVAGFRKGLHLIAKRLPEGVAASLESAFDDGRFTEVVGQLLVRYYDPLYQRSCVEGRRFVHEFETGVDAVDDAHRFIRDMAPLMGEVCSSGSPDRHR